MQYQEYTPSGAVGAVVARYWSMALGDEIPPGAPHRVIPDGCVDLVVMQKAAGPVSMTVRGARLSPLVIRFDPGDRYWGARLWPDVAACLDAVPASSLVERMYPGKTFFGEEAEQLGRALAVTPRGADVRAIWDVWLRPRLPKLSAVDPKVRLSILALNAAGGAFDLGRLASIVALSPRQLQRRFRRATGLTAKSYARIRRFRQSLAHVIRDEATAWSEVAARLGFADQSHLISEFSRLAGARPSDIAAYVRAFEHVDIVP